MRAESISGHHMACLTLNEEGDIVEVNVDQWWALEELRISLDAPFPVEIATLTRHDGVSAWLRYGICLLRGEAVNRLLACDFAERVLHIYEAAFPGDTRPRRAIEVARRHARGKATPAELKQARAAAHGATAAARKGIYSADTAAERCRSSAHAAYAASACAYADGAEGIARAAASSATYATAAAARREERLWQVSRVALYVSGVL